MARFIDDGALIKALERGGDFTVADILDILEDIPTAEVVEVRRADYSEGRHTKKTHKVICGFSGVGKSTAEQKSKHIYDLESSGWSWDFAQDPPARKPEFPANYINHLERLMSDLCNSVFLLSCHAEVRRELQNRGIPYVIVMPHPTLKNEYLKRWLSRGSDIEFIERMNDSWDAMIASCQEDSAPIIYLDSGEYISDLLFLRRKEIDQ